ncbi:MAG TPA: TauD/TfdA family dioxygenase [Micromonosporaceae bacterium]
MLDISYHDDRLPIVSAPELAHDPSWLPAHRDRLRSVAYERGAVLIRGLAVADAGQAAEASRHLLDELLIEREPFAPRRSLPGGVYTSTEWPADQPMCMHHELSYGREMPGMLVFSCLVAPTRGGSIALADAAAVLRDLPAHLVEQFVRVGWELRRNHNDVIGVPWPEAFGSSDPADVERYCRDNDIEWQWTADGGLQTRRRRPAVLDHPVTGVRVWCNQIAFLNEWTMDPAVRDYLTMAFGVDGLPYLTRFGDEKPIDRATVELINEVYARHTVREPWRAGDVLLVDNIRTAHSREPYEGEREIVVAMGDPVAVTSGDQSKLSVR